MNCNWRMEIIEIASNAITSLLLASVFFFLCGSHWLFLCGRKATDRYISRLTSSLAKHFCIFVFTVTFWALLGKA
jgi:hypothetical protein